MGSVISTGSQQAPGISQNQAIVAGTIAGAISIATGQLVYKQFTKPKELPVPPPVTVEVIKEVVKVEGKKGDDTVYALLGDVGGTNVRLVLKRLHFSDRLRSEIIKESNVDSKYMYSFTECLRSFLNVSL